MRARLFSSVLLAGVLFGAPAFAGEPSNDPAAEKARGDAAMDGYRLDEALEAYTHAYELGHDPAVLYNRGRVHQARSEWTRALDDLEQFDHDASPALKAKVPKLGQLLATVREHVSTLTIQCDVAGAHVFVRGVEIGVTPVAPQRLDAGTAPVRVETSGYATFAKDIQMPGGTPTTVDVHLVKAEAISAPIVVAPQADPQREKSKPITKEWWFWTGVGVVAAAAVVTIIVVANTEKSASDGTNFSPGRVSGPLTISW